ncbi:hypothetical protein METHB2_730002 [Candidatus Methylobacter favarea]|uniref:Uncharacterized protein n=1 Tax=Candidatus Methylobacter favarea TaxID=2707345 RepID=A0A8S0XIL6_9GAMM|nr:hypothetical protein METHB2_730002 [Candidatus Methylobacter favarea]
MISKLLEDKQIRKLIIKLGKEHKINNIFRKDMHSRKLEKWRSQAM